jgi:hypothetical protein
MQPTSIATTRRGARSANRMLEDQRISGALNGMDGGPSEKRHGATLRRITPIHARE